MEFIRQTAINKPALIFGQCLDNPLRKATIFDCVIHSSHIIKRQRLAIAGRSWASPHSNTTALNCVKHIKVRDSRKGQTKHSQTF
jgi:hypothetical protein